MRKGILMTLQDYMKLPYTRIGKEINDESRHYFHGRILELDGCQSTGDTAVSYTHLEVYKRQEPVLLRRARGEIRGAAPQKAGN